MRPGKFYTKIFLSFALILVITEILIFGLFLIAAGRSLRPRFEQHTRAQVVLAKELVEEKIKSEPEKRLAENESLRDFIQHLGETYKAKVWLADPDGTPLLKSFPGDIPSDIVRVAQRRAKDLGNFKMYRGFGKHGVFYTTTAVRVGKGEPGTLHVLFEKMETDHPGGVFALGLLGIGLVVALLIIPVSRLITDPVKRLEHSALQIAQGDLSHRADIRSRDEIGQLSRSFNRMADQLEKMIQGSRELTANISHELRSPLARIRMAEELLRERLERGKIEGWAKHLDDIREDIEELDHLIGRILMLSKLDLQERPANREWLNPADLIDELLDRFGPTIDRRGLAITKGLSVDFPIFGERDGLHTALSNILDNAVKFAPEEGNVIVEMKPGQDVLQVSITNTFQALPEDDLGKIFEPFYRTERSRAAGSGLGLAIAKRIIESHGGSIEAVNSPEGFRIQITLPTGRTT